MIHVINVKNPFNVREKTDARVPCTGGPVSSYHIPAGGVYHYAINGKPVNTNTIPVDGDEIVIMPYVGKKAFSWILTIGLTIAMGMITGGAGFAAGWSVGVRIGVGLAVSVLGGVLTNKLTPVPKIDVSNTEQSNTYGWGGAQTVTGQGYVLPTLYGRMKTGGIMLQRHVISDGERQYLNVLYCLAEGVLDSIENIKLNGNPIENYSGVEIEKRYGTNDQSVIPNFNDSYADTTLAYELNQNAGYSVYRLQGNTAEGLEVTLCFPQGMYYSNDKGGTDSTWVDISVQYKLVSASEWNTLFSGRIQENMNAAFYRTYRVLDIPAGQYEVRAACTGNKGTTIRYANKVQWVLVTQIIYDDFAHPGKALLGIRALATDQLSGSDPQMTCTIERNTVFVWSPEQKAYVERPASNPAWAAYDIMHQCRDFKGTKVVFGAKAACMDYYAFAAWAQMCESVGIEFHYLFDTPLRNWDAVCYPARIARGSVFMAGTKITCVYDFASLPVQLFTVSNVKKESFKEEFLEMAQRANAVEVSFMNKDKDYERDVLTVYGDDYDTTEAVINPTQIEIMGCTSVEQAYHFARWKLRENRYEIRTISFEAFADAIACKLGDVVLVQSDVALWGDGGRIEKVEGKVITVDRPVDTDYTDIMVRNQQTDEIHETKIVSIVENKITVATATGMSVDAIFAVGRAGKKPKKVKVLNIEKSHTEETRVITGIEYYDELYAPDTSAVPELPTYDNTISPPKDLILTWEVFSSNNGNARYLVNCTWINPVIPNTIKLEVSKNDGPWVLLQTLLSGTNSTRFDADPDARYTVRVYAENAIGRRSVSAYASIDMTDAYQAASVPADVKISTRFRELKDGVNRYDISVKWGPDGLRGQVYYKTNHVQVRDMEVVQGQAIKDIGFENGWTYAGEGINQIVIPQAITGDTYRIAICTADSTGLYTVPDNAQKFDYMVTAKTTTPNTPDGFSVTFGDEANATWNEVANADIEFYEVRTNTAVGKNTGLLARTSNLFAVLPLTERTGLLYLYAKGLLHYSLPAILDYNKPAPPKPSAPTLTAKLGGFSVVAGAIPSGCNGMNIYIDGASLMQAHSVNNVYTYTCDAGIYDVSVAYMDLFGEGPHSEESRISVKVLVDNALLEQMAVTKQNLDLALQASVDSTAQNVLDIAALQQEVNELDTVIETEVTAKVNELDAKVTNDLVDIETELNKAPSVCGYQAIQALNTADGTLSSTIANNKTTQDAVNATQADINAGITASGLKTLIQTNATSISQNATDITTLAGRVTVTENQLGGTATSVLKTAINQNASDITTLANRVTTTEDMLNGTETSALQTAINQNASGITAMASRVTTTENKLAGTTTSGLSQSIAAVDLKADGISSTVSTNKTAQDAVNAAQADINAGTTSSGLKTAILQNSTDISALAGRVTTTESSITTHTAAIALNASDILAVAGRVTTAEDKLAGTTTSGLSQSIAAVELKADGISARVTAAEGGITTNATNITANANGINGIISNLNSLSAAESAYTAFAALAGSVALKLTQGDMETYLQASGSGIQIATDMIKIDGNSTILAAGAAAVINALQAGSITADKLHVSSLSAISATIGTLRTATSGARTEIKDNLIEVYDSHNVLRVRMGVW